MQKAGSDLSSVSSV